MTANLLAALLIGLSSSAHCVFMCGGISTSLNMGQQQTSRPAWQISSLFHLGRISSYALIGLLLGGLLGIASSDINASVWLRLMAGALLVAMGLYLANIWRGLSHLETAMEPVWRPISVRLKKHIPARNGKDAIITGLFWGWLPCGLVYSTLAWAASSGNAWESASLMFAMGLGSTPALLGLSFVGHIFRHRSTALISGMALCVFGFWTMAMPVMSLMAEDSAHNHSSPMSLEATDTATPHSHHHH